MPIIENTRSKLALLRSDRRGAVAVVLGLTLTGMVGFSALAIDVGTALVVRKGIQASTDSAALAGAAVLAATGATAAMATATAQADLNSTKAATTVPVSITPNYPQTRCLTSIGVACTGTPAVNAVVIKQQARVNTYFTRLFGFSYIDVSATSTAAIAGGVNRPVNVQIVLDTTGSMKNTDTNCSKSKINCAIGGGKDLLTGMAPSSSKVGLMMFPPTTSATQAARAYDCNSGTNPAVARYNQSGLTYNILAPSNDFRSSDTSPVGASGNNLDPNSNLTKAVGGSTSCSGMAAVGGVGTYYADAITAAQTQLAALPVDATNPAQNVIILLSDGDATASKTKYQSGGKTVQDISDAKWANQCKQAVDAAALAKAAGTVIYSVAYDAPTSGGCGSDQVAITPCAAMTAIASSSAHFFTSDSGGGLKDCKNGSNTTGLATIFQNIGQTFRGTRLVPNNSI